MNDCCMVPEPVLTVLQILASGAELELGSPALRGSFWSLADSFMGGRSGLSLLAGGLWAAVLVYVTWSWSPNLSEG